MSITVSKCKSIESSERRIDIVLILENKYKLYILAFDFFRKRHKIRILIPPRQFLAFN